MGGVAIADVDTGFIQDIILTDIVPVGLFHFEEMNLMFVSCRSKEVGGRVYAYDIDTHVIKYTYTTHKMTHPTGTSSSKIDFFKLVKLYKIVWSFCLM